jgi:hypothetical protein
MSLPNTTITKPPQAVQGAQRQAKAAYDSIPAANRHLAFQKVRTRLGSPQQYVRPALGPQTLSGVSRTKSIDGYAHYALTFDAQEPGAMVSDGTDADLDRLPDKFEKRVANAFMPSYYVSAGETAVFATFLDQPTLAIASLSVATPPIVHSRVTPLGIRNGMGWLQVDYLTIWNRDNGLSVSDLCATLTAGLGLSLDGLAAHEFDEERSAVLVGAPSVGGTYASDATMYRAHV